MFALWEFHTPHAYCLMLHSALWIPLYICLHNHIADTASGVEEGQTAHGQGKDRGEGLEEVSASRDNVGFDWQGDKGMSEQRGKENERFLGMQCKEVALASLIP